MYHRAVAVLSSLRTFDRKAARKADDQSTLTIPPHVIGITDPTLHGDSLSRFCENHIAGSRECCEHLKQRPHPSPTLHPVTRLHLLLMLFSVFCHLRSYDINLFFFVPKIKWRDFFNFFSEENRFEFLQKLAGNYFIFLWKLFSYYGIIKLFWKNGRGQIVFGLIAARSHQNDQLIVFTHPKQTTRSSLLRGVNLGGQKRKYCCCFF